MTNCLRWRNAIRFLFVTWLGAIAAAAMAQSGGLQGHAYLDANTNGHYDNLPDVAPEQIMTRNVITVTANEPLTAAINKLIENRVDQLVVVQRENGHQTPVGILSMADLARLSA